MAHVTIKLEWHKKKIDIQLFNLIERNVSDAADLYWRELRKSIKRWGSIPYGAGRLSVRRSSPGEAPMRQTGNLYNSILSLVKHERGKEQIIGVIYTTVPYAPTLEFGGALQVDQKSKQHVTDYLVNPFRKVVNVLPRPAWLPTYNKTLPKMIKKLSRRR